MLVSISPKRKRLEAGFPRSSPLSRRGRIGRPGVERPQAGVSYLTCLTTADGIAAERLSGRMLRKTKECRTAIAAASANMTPSVILTSKLGRI
jgi:hypothetical protein